MIKYGENNFLKWISGPDGPSVGGWGEQVQTAQVPARRGCIACEQFKNNNKLDYNQPAACYHQASEILNSVINQTLLPTPGPYHIHSLSHRYATTCDSC